MVEAMQRGKAVLTGAFLRDLSAREPAFGEGFHLPETSGSPYTLTELDGACTCCVASAAALGSLNKSITARRRSHALV